MDIPLEQKKGLKKKHIPYLLGGAVLIFIVWLIFSDHSSSLVIDSRTITTGTARKALFNDYIQVQGSVQPITTLQLTPLESGMVEKRLIEEGSSVKEGDIIVMLSNQNLNAEVLNSESQLSNRENDLHNARIAMEQERLNLQKEQLTLNLDIQRKKRVFQQKKKLYEEKLVAREEYLQAQEDHDLAEQSRDIMLERQTQDSLARAPPDRPFGRCRGEHAQKHEPDPATGREPEGQITDRRGACPAGRRAGPVRQFGDDDRADQRPVGFQDTGDDRRALHRQSPHRGWKPNSNDSRKSSGFGSTRSIPKCRTASSKRTSISAENAPRTSVRDRPTTSTSNSDNRPNQF